MARTTMKSNYLSRFIFIVAGIINIALTVSFFSDRDVHQTKVFGSPSNFVLLMEFFPDQTSWLPLACSTLDNFLWGAVAYAGFLYVLHGISNLTYLTVREVMEFLILKFLASACIILIHGLKSHYSEHFQRGEWARIVAVIDTVMAFAFLFIGSLRTSAVVDEKKKHK